MSYGGVESILNLSLILDNEHGLTLVDTGLPGQMDLIEEALRKDGFTISELKQIILTHQDIDHVGSLHRLKERTLATVYAFSDEVPYIDGTIAPIKMPSRERLAEMPEIAAWLKLHAPTSVDESIQDRQVLTKSAGAVVIATPGHTPGHISLYLPTTRTLIAGDALTSEAGTLSGPGERGTPDMALAGQSVKKLAELDVETIVCYHGGLVTEGASGQLERVAG